MVAHLHDAQPLEAVRSREVVREAGNPHPRRGSERKAVSSRIEAEATAATPTAPERPAPSRITEPLARYSNGLLVDLADRVPPAELRARLAEAVPEYVPEERRQAAAAVVSAVGASAAGAVAPSPAALVSAAGGPDRDSCRACRGHGRLRGLCERPDRSSPHWLTDRPSRAGRHRGGSPSICQSGTWPWSGGRGSSVVPRGEARRLPRARSGHRPWPMASRVEFPKGNWYCW